MRLFIAAVLPEEAKLKIEEYMHSLKAGMGGVKWEPYEKLHVTLKFLGNTEKGTASKAAQIVHNLCNEYSSLDMTVTRLGGLPDLERPRLLYLGLSQNDDLASLRNTVDRSLSGLGFEEEKRRFLPHVTLGRVKNRFHLRDSVPIPEKFSFTISQIAVIKSELHSRGSLHTPLAVFDLSSDN